MSDDLVQFLRARLDEDAELAAGASPGPWHVSAESDEVLAVDDITVAEGFALSGRQLRATTVHIARHDPARVLVEVEAGRVVLQQYESLLAVCSDDHTGVWAVEAIMRAKARTHRDHPDFNPAWLED